MTRVQGEYGPLAREMSELARSIPGHISHKGFVAEDSERVTIVEFESEEGQSRPGHRNSRERRSYIEFDQTEVILASKQHTYCVTVRWTGNHGTGTSSHGAYGRDHVISAGSKPAISGSSPLALRGDSGRWNPEDLLVASLSACHKLWYLGLCAKAGIRVLTYEDHAEGTMVEESSGSGRFTHVRLRPRISLQSGDDIAAAMQLHHQAHENCFIANSVNFPVECDPEISA